MEHEVQQVSQDLKAISHYLSLPFLPFSSPLLSFSQSSSLSVCLHFSLSLCLSLTCAHGLSHLLHFALLQYCSLSAHSTPVLC